MKKEYVLLREQCMDLLTEMPREEFPHGDLYGTCSIIWMLRGSKIEEANRVLQRAAMYMDLPHPEGRSVTGENDFAAIRLVAALFLVKDKMTPETLVLVRRFLLERDFTSCYFSENHVFMIHVARYLAAQTLNEDFKQYHLTARQAMEIDKKYIMDFILFRAKRGVGEFTSSYLNEDLFMLGMLTNYCADPELKNMAQMGIDSLALEAFNNLNAQGMLCGGSGRTYPDALLNPEASVPSQLWDLLVNRNPHPNANFVLAPFVPDDFILEAVKNRTFPCEVFERKHLHSMSAWQGNSHDDAWLETLERAGAISKYTYLSAEYGLGAIQHQDPYPESNPDDAVYAHHQQVEWSLVLPAKEKDRSTKIFSHHPGDFGEHNYWSGDLKCCCNQSFATKDTVMTIYNITHPGELEFTHMFLEPAKYDEVRYEENWIFLRHENRYIAVFIAGGYEVTSEGEFAGKELVSQGLQNAYICRIGLESEYGSLDAFVQKIHSLPLSFDRKAMRLEFDHLYLTPTENGVDGVKTEYPYPDVYLAPWCRAKWNEGVLEVFTGKNTVQMDFNRNKVIVL